MDFSNDYEFHVLVSGKHDATGLEYGAHMEFEGDTDSAFNTDEEWLWLRGGFGEFRFGDEDGVVDSDSIGAYTIAANTGGIDGDVLAQLSIGTVRPSNTNDLTKINYHTPSFGGFQVGLTYTPNNPVLNSGVANGDTVNNRRVAVSNEVEGSLVYKGDFAGLGLQASVVGSTGKADGGVIRGPGHNSDTFWTVYGGAATTIFGLKLAGGAGAEDTGGLKRDYFNAGAGLSFGPVNLSINYGKVVDSSGYDANKPWIAIARLRRRADAGPGGGRGGGVLRQRPAEPTCRPRAATRAGPGSPTSASRSKDRRGRGPRPRPFRAARPRHVPRPFPFDARPRRPGGCRRPALRRAARCPGAPGVGREGRAGRSLGPGRRDAGRHPRCGRPGTGGRRRPGPLPGQPLDVAQEGRSSASQNDSAMPSAPARAVRPMRWT